MKKRTKHFFLHINSMPCDGSVTTTHDIGGAAANCLTKFPADIFDMYNYTNNFLHKYCDNIK